MPMQAIASRVVLWQLTVALISAALWFGTVGREAAEAAFVGGMIALVPNAFMALSMFSRRAMRTPKTMVRAFYFGEAGKFALTLIGFGVAIPVYHADFLSLIVTYIFTLMMSWFALAKGNI